MNPTLTAWLCLISAGILEVVWAVGMKHSDGFTKLFPSLIALIGVSASLYLLSLAIKQLPLGLAYAVWVGIGASMVAAYGMLFFKEPTDLAHLACIGLILIGVIGLNLLSSH